MNNLAKITLILGILLLIFSFAIPDNYEICHSDLRIAGYNDSQNCYSDLVYQISEAAMFVGIICIFSAPILKEFFDDTDKSISLTDENQ